MTASSRTGTASAATGSGPARFNPFSAEFRRDPYPMYRMLRETNPVHKTLGMWVLTRHADVRAVLRDKTFGAGLIPELVSARARRVTPDETRVEQLARKSLVFTEDPDHARLRALVNRAFSARSVARLRGRIRSVADELVEQMCAAGEVDAVTDLAIPLPVRVMCEWMALPDHLRDQVGSWTHDIRYLLEPGLLKADDFTRVRSVVDTFARALDAVVQERRAHPGDDLVSHLLATRTAGGDQLSDDELVFVCIMCFVAGNETTASLIGNGLLALARYPLQADHLHRHPELAGDAADEVVRYDSPLQMTKRVATQETEIGGQRVAAGDQVLLCLGAANRDPEVFGEPDTFDISRDTRGHLAFGHGMHGCLGALLARLQAEVAFASLVAHADRIKLIGEVTWQDHSMIVRGLRHLPLAVQAGR